MNYQFIVIDELLEKAGNNIALYFYFKTMICCFMKT